MQHLNWDDLRFFVALSRSRSFSGAARALGVDGTTVSRRIRALEQVLAAQLIVRTGSGKVQLTEAGCAVSKVAENTEQGIEYLQASVSNSDADVKGRVRLTAVPVMANRVLIPALQSITKHHPNLEILLLPDNRNLNLMNREADIAIRLARPIDGGHQIKARKIGALAHAVYVAKDLSDAEAEDCPWVSYQDGMEHLPQAQWVKKEQHQTGARMSTVRVSEFEGAIEAVAHRCGRSVLPCLVGDTDIRLRRLVYGNATPMFEREVWLLVHSDMLHLARIRVVLDWLDCLIE